MGINDDFLNKYNRLDSMLRYLVNGQEGKNYIFFYEKILSFNKRPVMEEIRHFKNSHKSHGVSNNDQPIAPRSWISFLQEQIDFVEHNKSVVRSMMLQIIEQFPDKNNNHRPAYSNNGFRNDERNFTKYPVPPWNVSISRFMFYDHILRDDTINYDSCDLAGIMKAIAEYEHLVKSKHDLVFPSNYESKLRVIRFGDEFKSDDFVSNKMPLENDTMALFLAFRLNQNTILWFFFNTRYNWAGSIILCVAEPDGYHANNWIGKCYGLYYFKRTGKNCNINKMLSGAKVCMKTAKNK